MATDATGTPTSLGIPTYNINVDAPSGNGNNAQMQAIDALLQLRATLSSPAFTGTPTAPTPATADNTTKIATTAFVKAQNYITSGGAPVQTVFGRSGAVVQVSGDYTVAQVTGAAPIDSPTFTTTAAAPTPATADNSTKIATTAFVKAQGYLTTAVASFKGRTGAVTPASGDYTAAQVTNAADTNTTTNQNFNGGLVSNKSTGGGVGYATGAGATATLSAAASNPLTSTGALSGTITAVSSVPASGSTYYGVSGGGWAAGDVILVSLVNGTPGTANNYYATVVSVGAGTFSFYFFNAGASAITPSFNFVALKAVTS